MLKEKYSEKRNISSYQQISKYLKKKEKYLLSRHLGEKRMKKAKIRKATIKESGKKKAEEIRKIEKWRADESI